MHIIVPTAFEAASVRIGDPIPELSRQVTRVTMFIFSASYFGTHLFHYDVESARKEGFPDVIVTSNLICSYFEQAIRAWSGNAQLLRSLEERSISTAYAGDELLVSGVVVNMEKVSDGLSIICDLKATAEPDRLISTCRAEIVVPE